MDALKQSSDDFNKSQVSQQGALTKAENDRTTAMKASSDATSKLIQQQTLLNKAENDGFDSPQQALAYKQQETSALTNYNKALNNGRTTVDQVLQDKRNLTQTQTDQNAAIKGFTDGITQAAQATSDFNASSAALAGTQNDVKSSTDGLAASYDDAKNSLDTTKKSAEDLRSGVEDLNSGFEDAVKSSSDLKRGVDGTGTSIDDLASKIKAATSYSDSFSNSLARSLINQLNDLKTAMGSGSLEADELAQKVRSTTGSLSLLEKAAGDNSDLSSFFEKAHTDLDSYKASLGDAEAGTVSLGDDALDLSKHLDDTSNSSKGASSTVDRMALSFVASTASGVNLSNQLAKVNTDLEALDRTSSTGFSDQMITQLGKISDAYTKVSNQLKSNPAAAPMLVDTGQSLDALALKFQDLSRNLDNADTELDKTGKSASGMNAASVVLSSNLSKATSTLEDLRGQLSNGGLDFDSFVSSIAKGNTSLVALKKSAVAVGDSDSITAVQNLQEGYDKLASSALASKNDTAVFKSAIDGTSLSLDDNKKSADGAASSLSGLLSVGNSLDNTFKKVATDLSSFSAILDHVGGSGGSGGILGSVLGGLGGAASSGVGALSSLASMLGTITSLAVPVVSFGLAIPTIVSSVVALGGALVGLLGALAPVVGVFATALPLIAGLVSAFGAVSLAIGPLSETLKDLHTNTAQSMAAFATFDKPIQEAANSIFGLQKAFGGLAKMAPALADDLLTPMEYGLKGLASIAQPIIQTFGNMATAIGKSIEPILTAIEYVFQSGLFTTMAAAAMKAFENIGASIGMLIVVLAKLGAAAAPYLVELTAGFHAFTENLDNMLSIGIKDGGLDKFFNQMVTGLSELGKVITGLIQVLGQWGGALAPIGNNILVGLANGLDKLAAAANKVNFSQWTSAIENFLQGIGGLLSAVVNVLGAFADSRFVNFAADLLKDLSPLINDLQPIAEFLKDIAAGSLPVIETIFHSISGWVGDILKGVGDFLGVIEKIQPIMDVLSAIFAGLATLVISASVISFFQMLSGVLGKGLSGIIDLLNKIPGINIPGGGSSGTGTAAADTGAAGLNDAATSLNEAAAALQSAADAQSAAAGDTTASATSLDTSSTSLDASSTGLDTSATSLDASAAELKISRGISNEPGGGPIVPTTSPAAEEDVAGGGGLAAILKSGFGKVLSGVTLGSAVVLGGNVVADQTTKANSKLNSAIKEGSDIAGGAVTGGKIAGLPGAVIGAGVGEVVGAETNPNIRPTVNKDMSEGNKIGGPILGAPVGFGVGLAQSLLPDSVKKAIQDFFTKTLPGYASTAYQAVSKAFLSPFTNFWTQTLPRNITNWAKSVGSAFATAYSMVNKDFFSPIGSFFSKTFPGFFKTAASNVASWATTSWNDFTKFFALPVSSFFTKTLPGFFKSAASYVASWASTSWNDFTKFFALPVSSFFTKTLGGFFVQALSYVANWANSGWNDVNKYFISPMGSFFSKTLGGFFVQALSDVANWATDGWNDVNKYFVSPLGSFFSKTLPDFFVQAASDVSNWATSGWNDFNKFFISPIADFFSKTIPDFFNQALTDASNWATNGWNDFNKFFVSPLSDFFSKTIPNFFSAATTDVLNWVTAGWNDFNKAFVSPISNFFSSTLTGFLNTATNEVLNWVTTGWNDFNKDFVSPISNFFSSTLTGFLNTAANEVSSWASTGWNDFNKFFVSPVSSFFTSTIPGLATGAGNAIQNAFKNAMNWVISNVIGEGSSPSSGVIGLLNKVLGVVSIHIAGLPGLSTGGLVPGSLAESDTSDSQLARLTPGEFVVRKKAAKALGLDFLNNINNADKYADGGAVRGYAGGGGIIGGIGSAISKAAGTVANAASSTVQAAAGGVTGIVNGIEGLASGAISGLVGLVAGSLQPAFDAIWSATIQPMIAKLGGSDESLGTGGAAYAIGSMKSGIDSILGAKDKAAQQAAASVNLPGDAAAWITQGMAAAGVSGPAWQQGLSIIAKYESGGNQGAVNNTDSNAQAGHPCVTLDTMILTKRGWLAYDQVQVNDETIGYNPVTGTSEWTRVTKVHLYDDAPIWEISNSRWSARVTPNHRWWSDTAIEQPKTAYELCPECGWVPGTGRNPKLAPLKDKARSVATHRAKEHGVKKIARKMAEEYRGEFVETQDLKYNHRIRVAALAETGPGLPISDDEAAILGWLIGDGHFNSESEGTWRGTIYQSKQHVVSIRALLSRNTQFSEGVRQRENSMMPQGKMSVSKLPSHAFGLTTAFVTDLFKRAQFDGTDCESLVLALNSSQRKAWITAMIDAEGHTEDGYTRIAQAEGSVHDAIILAVYLEGYNPRIVHNRTLPGYKKVNNIGMARPHISPVNLTTEVQGNEPVWCVSTELGTWTMEQDGNPMLTGNSAGLLQFIQPTFDAYAKPGFTTWMNPVDQVVADCVTLDTMILTKRGYLKHDEVVIGDETLGYNIATGLNEWTPIKRVVHYSDAPTVRIGSKHVSYQVTPNHKWVAEKYRHVPKAPQPDSCPDCDFIPSGSVKGQGLAVHRKKAHGWAAAKQEWAYQAPKLVESEDITSRHRLRVSAPATTGTGLPISLIEAELLGWVLGDGSYIYPHRYARSGDVPRFNIYQTKEGYIPSIQALVDEVDSSAHVYKTVVESGRLAHTWKLTGAYSRDLAERSGYAEDKLEAMVFAMSHEQREAFLRGIIGAEGTAADRIDGSRGGNLTRIPQVYGPKFEAILLTTYLLGYRPSVSDKKQSNSNWSAAGIVSTCKPVISATVYEDAGNADVWCVTTGLGTWTARDGHNVFLTGNSWSGGYIPKRYGSIGNVPGVKSVEAGGPYIGYAEGGPVGGMSISDVIGSIGFSSPAVGALASGGSVSIPSSMMRSPAAQSSGGKKTGYGVHIDSLNIHNPIPEQTSTSLQNRLSVNRVYGGRA